MSFFLLMLACGSDKAGGDPTGSDTGWVYTPGDGGACTLLVDSLDLPSRIAPGDTVALPAALDPRATLTWTVSAGEVTDLSWTLPDDSATHVDEVHSVQVTASAVDCAEEQLEGQLDVGWEESDRVVVLHNPSVAGSTDVAEAYAALHGLAADQRCAIETDADTTLAGEDLLAFVDGLAACLDRVGPQVHVIVPTYGVPYKVSGRIEDISGSGSIVTTSLDALLVYGRDATALSAAIWNPLWITGDSMAGSYDPWLPFGEQREDYGDDYFLVARIDGADTDAALALLDRTADAMERAAAGTLDGIVYVDGRYGDTPPTTDDFGSYEAGEWNMWGTATLFQDLGWYDVVWDGNSEEFGTKPAPVDCPDALYYAGWYSYYNYNDAFTWAPGAIGGHLDSCSACDIRSDGTWSGSALSRGITATFGAVAEPYVAGMPEYDQLFRYLTQGASFGEAAYQSTRIGGWMMVFVGDPLYRPYPAD